MIVKKGEYSIVDPDAVDNSDSEDTKNKSKKEDPSDPKFSDKAKKMGEIPEVTDGDNEGVKKFRDFDTPSEKIEKAKNITNDNKPSKIHKGEIKQKDWKRLTSTALSRNSATMSDEAKNILKKIITAEPLVDWKRELKKFFDDSFKGEEWVMPNKRYLAGGDTLYGRKPIGDDTLKTIVAAVDTSGSISKAQVKVFVNEIMYLCKQYSAEKTIIIYCSDDIDNVDIVKKGQQPDFTKIASTGGNAKGFIPPFQWVEKNKIKPSIFVYLTDTGGSMPDGNKYGIKKYVKKVIWFICSPTLYNKPPFGKILMAPTAAIKS